MKKMPVATVDQVPMVRVATGAPVKRKRIYTLTMSANGQFTLPKELREELDLHPGDTLILTPRTEDFVMHKRVGLREEMAEWRKGLSKETNEMIKKTAGWTLNQYHEYFDNLPENVAKMEREYGFKEN